MPKSEVGSALCVSATRRRPRCARGGRCFAGFLDPTVHGKKTPVPPRGNLLGVITIGRTGANISSCGARRTPTPHLETTPVLWSQPSSVPAGTWFGTLGCHTVIADDVFSQVSVIRTLKKVTLIRLVGDWHMTWRAMSALFPLITNRDLCLQNKKHYYLYYAIWNYGMCLPLL